MVKVVSNVAACSGCGQPARWGHLGGWGDVSWYCFSCWPSGSADSGGGGEGDRAVEAVGGVGDEPEDMVPAAGRGEG